ncbi:unnamed protein product [Lymnaea stagnalis]|uniref:Beta-1,3-galactosyl-O-glycosyl-glycoprotein beta-1,6-N-acetylglucosaminyltransferase n=1 Tax=Lymnaea stagnalis TaxID=6523 RepID=A0AAV2IFG9_LYMST
MLTRLHKSRCWHSLRGKLPYTIAVIVFGLACNLLIHHIAVSRPHAEEITGPFKVPSQTKHASMASTNKVPASCTLDQGTVEQLIQRGQLFKVHEANCSKLFLGDKSSIEAAIQIAQAPRTSLGSDFYLNITTNCDVFHKSRGYVMSSLTREEEEFPIAFSLVVYTDLEMAERLLRAIYRPHNFYCVHVDRKVPSEYFRAVSNIIRCLPNVFLSSKRLNVRWGTFSVLHTELVCMRDLWRHTTWKYFINLTGQEFPLKTNLELVRILKAYKGANDIRGMIKTANRRRWKNTRPPYGIRPVKGSVHITASRAFVDYVLHNETAHAVLQWTRKTEIPDETFFATINHNPQLNLTGTYKGRHPDELNIFMTRYKIWNTRSRCAGRFQRMVCMLSTGDLPRLGQAKHLFANKFMLNEDRLVIGCLEEKLANHTRDEYMCTKVFNASYYANLKFVKNRVRAVT